MRASFDAWLHAHAQAWDADASRLLFNFYNADTGARTTLYPMLSGKLVLWLLAQDRVDEAVAVADKLLEWQQTDDSNATKHRSYGGFPSLLTNSGGGNWVAGDGVNPIRYYSGDGLVILAALLALYDETSDADYLTRATLVGDWLVEVMSDCVQFGIWYEDHGAPVEFVDSAGNFSSHILTSCYMWIGALDHLSVATSDASYGNQADDARAFYALGQIASGPFWDHYDPIYPPVAYDVANWDPHASGGLLADSTLRAAIGAAKAGDLTAAAETLAWIQVGADAGVFGYLDVSTGGPLAAMDPDYYDEVSTALYRALCQWCDQLGLARGAQRRLLALQAANGGWYWGQVAATCVPLADDQAVIVGLWAGTDLSTFTTTNMPTVTLEEVEG
jgi:hypothetical protein